MRTVFFFILSVLTSASNGKEERVCTNDDTCASMLFNQLALTNITEEMIDLKTYVSSLLQESAAELNTLMIPLRALVSANTHQETDLKDCHNQHKDFNIQIENLQELNLELMNVYEGLDAEITQLQKDKEELIQAKKPFEDKKCKLDEKDAQLKERIWNLTTVFYKPFDCADIQLMGNNKNGVYTIYPYRNERKPVNVLCDLESNGGGWTVFFARQPQIDPLDFNESWQNFKKGFGSITSEFWLGNDLLTLFTSSDASMVRIDGEDFTGDQRWAEWKVFNVGDEANKYLLTIEDYQNTSTMGDSFSEISNSAFTTFDRDNDLKSDSNCAVGHSSVSSWGKGGWWYKDCGYVRLTAPLKNTNYWNSACYGNWDPQGMKMVSLKSLSMKFRRLSYNKKLADIDVAVLNQEVEEFCL